VIARQIVHGLLSRIREGQLIVVEDGRRTAFGSGAPCGLVHVHSPELWTRLLHGGRGLAEAYRDGLWTSPDPTAVLRVAARNVHGLDAARRRLAPLREPYLRARSAFVRNTPRRARKDIEAHYDLGDDLFERMLDPTMMYSCALFDRPRMTLEEASLAKLELIYDKLDLQPQDHLLEIGTGWGSLAINAARARGCRVTTTTISRDQYETAVRRVRAAGLEDRVTVLLEDYRSLRGRFDKLVSVEMVEAVGWKDFDTFFARCSELLAPDGAMLLQAITIDDRAYRVERLSRSFIRTHIFPNGCLPSQEVIARCVARETDMRAVHMEDLTPHYAETLRLWRENFDASEDELEAAGYDERFRRLWRLYLCYCEAGFAEHRIGLAQVLLAKPRRRQPAVRPGYDRAAMRLEHPPAGVRSVVLSP
jgi:cyclopropane-fatty-acyl-phospholipid synthase